MTDKQIIIDESKINPNDWLEPYKPIPSCEIKDCDHLVYAGNNVYGCRIAEDGLVCDDFNNDDECCMYRQLEYYKEALKAKEQECKNNKTAHQMELDIYNQACLNLQEELKEALEQLDQLKAENDELKRQHQADKGLITSTGKMNYQLIQEYDKLKTENEECIKDNEYLKTIIKDFTQEVVKLKTALTEIKEIVGIGLVDGLQTEEYSGFLKILQAQILQKISECEGNDERMGMD